MSIFLTQKQLLSDSILRVIEDEMISLGIHKASAFILNEHFGKSVQCVCTSFDNSQTRESLYGGDLSDCDSRH